MSGAWKPGDVAMVQCSDGVSRRAMYFTSDVTPAWIFPDRMLRRAGESTARPLVVIDPEDRDGIRGLVAHLSSSVIHGATLEDSTSRAMGYFRSVAIDPKPAEPIHDGAVVVDTDGHRHVRTARNDGRPWCGGEGKFRSWGQIRVVEILSEGVTA